MGFTEACQARKAELRQQFLDELPDSGFVSLALEDWEGLVAEFNAMVDEGTHPEEITLDDLRERADDDN